MNKLLTPCPFVSCGITLLWKSCHSILELKGNLSFGSKWWQPKKNWHRGKTHLFVTLNWQEIRYLEELAYRDQAAQGRDGQRGHCSWLVAQSDPVMKDGELCLQYPASFQHGNERACPPPLPQSRRQSRDADPASPPLDTGATLPRGNVAARFCTPGHVCPCAVPPKCICVHFNKKTPTHKPCPHKPMIPLHAVLFTIYLC